MTKRWSSTKSGDGLTMRDASKLARRLRKLDEAPAEATFDNADDMLKWLDSDGAENRDAVIGEKRDDPKGSVR